MNLNLINLRLAVLAVACALLASACSSEPIAATRSEVDQPVGQDVEIIVADSDGVRFNLTVIDLDGRALITDTDGRVVYGNTRDTLASLFCVDTCTDTWVPVPTNGGGVSGRLDESLLGTRSRPDGTGQATYDGIALYTFSGAQNPGSLNGIGVAGIWFALNADGSRITRPVE